MKLALLGDIALFGCCQQIDYFKNLGDYLCKFDYVVGNLETPFSVLEKKHGAKSAYICANPSIAEILRFLHLNAVNLANNHMFDYGREGYEKTKEILYKLGIEWFGTEGKDLQFDMCGAKLAFSGYCCYSSNPLQCVRQGKYGVNAYNLIDVQKFIKNKVSEGFFPIVAVHAGLEHVNYPSIDHVKAARKLADEHPYVYYGHHPHVIQGVEEYKGSLIAHSLGNFCFDDVYSPIDKEKPLIEMTENNRTGMILELTIEDGMVKNWKEQILYIGKERMELIETPQEVFGYNQRLMNSTENTTDYNNKRNAILNRRLEERKAMRNLSWFLKRLRPRYFRLMFDMKKNVKLYNDNVLNYL